MINKVNLAALMMKKPLQTATQTRTSPETTHTSNIHQVQDTSAAERNDPSTHPTATLQTIDSNTSKDSKFWSSIMGSFKNHSASSLVKPKHDSGE